MASSKVSERVCQELRELIMDGRLVGGTHLKETVSSRGVGASRTPIREALVQIECEGLAVRATRGSRGTSPRRTRLPAAGADTEVVDVMISGWTKERAGDEILEEMREAEVPVGGAFTAEDMVEDPHYAARENVVEVEDPDIGPFPMQNVVPRLSGTPGEVRWTGPALGQHNDEVYGKVLGLSQEEREGLRERGVI